MLDNSPSGGYLVSEPSGSLPSGYHDGGRALPPLPNHSFGFVAACWLAAAPLKRFAVEPAVDRKAPKPKAQPQGHDLHLAGPRC